MIITGSASSPAVAGIEWQKTTEWRCCGCGRILLSYSVTPPTAIRIRCAKCHAWNYLVAVPCPLCGEPEHGGVILTNERDEH